ncbi:MAG: hypothetical protein Tsb0014_19390 [Pleurocapsa sp.]
MLDRSNVKSSNQTDKSDRGYVSAPPAVSLPEGGGAIAGIGEKFSMNPVTGTGSLSIPIFVSPGRSGFSPQLTLNYDSGAGNSSFGLGCSLGVPSITRKTQKGLPQYRDAEDSDIFLLSGAEDLVPVLNGNPPNDEYNVRRYRPRIEGLFARIERWQHKDTGDVHWRSLTKDNVTSIYGKDSSSRVVAPEDSTRIFEWLLCESYDDKGNVIIYQYKQEDTANVDASLPQEQNRLLDGHSYTQQYLKKVFYGNQKPFVRDNWLFQVVFDYGTHDVVNPMPDVEVQPWLHRKDAFSSFRSGFEIRTQRLCQRVLMFHRFDEAGQINTTDKRWYLVRSTDFGYEPDPVATYLITATQTGYSWDETAQEYRQKSYPPLELSYDRPKISDEIKYIDAESLENLPVGLDGGQYQWLDLDGEGISGILTEQAGGWFYKANLGTAKFAPLQVVETKPSLSNLSNSQQRFMDLAGDGQQDLVLLNREHPGFYERSLDEEWSSFKAFHSVPNVDWNDPNLRMIDLNGDGHADILISEQEVFVWYPSQAEAGFGQSHRVHKLFEEERSPAVIFADAEQSVYLADMTGDGLNDIVRIRNGEVCYWANRGYGKFGSKVTMGNAPYFDHPELFNQQRIKLADIDGSGTTDLIYLGREQVQIWFNQAGNSWSEVHQLNSFPPVDNLTSVQTVDLFGNGTACLVWSSSLPGATHQQMQYIDLMGGQKPHLLRGIQNNLGAETRLDYAASTKFYLEDKQAGKPWITKIPFPVQVVERVETLDHISGNKFVSSYKYRHGYFDGEEREFRGFGYVEQLDTETFELFQGDGVTNATDEKLHIPPIKTKTWFHTGAFIDRDRISNYFAREEYYREPRHRINPDTSPEDRRRKEAEFQTTLLPDTCLPSKVAVRSSKTENGEKKTEIIFIEQTMTAQEEREACRALKGSILRQELYAEDDTEKSPYPYSVSERNYELKWLQSRHQGQYGVFFAHPKETIDYYYERNPEDPRISHSLNLEVDAFGNVLQSVAIAYPRRQPQHQEQGGIPASGNELAKDKGRPLITYQKNRVVNKFAESGWYRLGIPIESSTYEITGLEVELKESEITDENSLDDSKSYYFEPFNLEWLKEQIDSAEPIDYEKFADETLVQKRLIEKVKTFYRKNEQANTIEPDFDFLKPEETIDSLALPAESFKLASTPGLLTEIYRSKIDRDILLLDRSSDEEDESNFSDQGGYVKRDGLWWIPSGRQAFDPGQFYLPIETKDPFEQHYTITYDEHSLLVISTKDPLDNIVLVKNNYRVMQPEQITDPNGNRTEVKFDALGMVAGTAVMGKVSSSPQEGDSLDSFETDLSQQQLNDFSQNPLSNASTLLGNATTRIIYDLERFRNSGQPVFAATLARETHVSNLDTKNEEQSIVQVSFLYSDGFGREAQTKIQAESGLAPSRDADGKLEKDAAGELIWQKTDRRWVGTGRTVYNNKGKPVKQYEPFFSSSHQYEQEKELVEYGVTPIVFYDPLGRAIATLHPNHTYEKVLFTPWYQQTWDVNDTVLLNPIEDEDVKGYIGKYLQAVEPNYQTWYQLRVNGDRGSAEQQAADKTEQHGGTPTDAYLDILGRTFLTVANNGKNDEGNTLYYLTHVKLDIEGNPLSITDARGNEVMVNGVIATDDLGNPVKEDRLCWAIDREGAWELEKRSQFKLQARGYDLLGNKLRFYSADAGERWILNNVAGNPIRAWDSRGHQMRYKYDQLQRLTHLYVQGGDYEEEILAECTVYGEKHPQAAEKNKNLRGQVYQLFDAAGVVTNSQYDFKGNLLKSDRQIGKQYRQRMDWKQADLDPLLDIPVDTKLNIEAIETAIQPHLEADDFYPEETTSFTTETAYDALNRPIWVKTPDQSITRPSYNEANLPEEVEVQLRGRETGKKFVKNIDYNAKGQRTKIEYGNGVTTEYDYYRDTFRLHKMFTYREVGSWLQNLHYTYNPVGNITQIQDEAQQTIFFNGEVVSPSCNYRYDAIYRLIEAKGREHRGQTNHNRPEHRPEFKPHYDFNDSTRIHLDHPHNGEAMRNYTRSYKYDQVGNIEKMTHQAADNEWHRDYQYAEDSNRLLKTSLPDHKWADYIHDANGNTTQMPHLSEMQWDFEDQLQATAKQVVNNGNVPETTYYVYDASGQRVRKVTEKSSDGTVKRVKERIYLGGFEIYREYDSTGITVKLERETLHVMDGEQRIALVETKTHQEQSEPFAENPTQQPIIRYQLNNHLGSSCIEVDDTGAVISYEEYYPYGSTSYQAGKNKAEVSRKRYRYTGKERDEETGFYYYGARYYVSWLGRWLSCDPAGFVDGLNIYVGFCNNPIKYKELDGEQVSSTISNPLSVSADDFTIRAKNILSRGISFENKARQLRNELNIPDRGTGVRGGWVITDNSGYSRRIDFSRWRRNTAWMIDVERLITKISFDNNISQSLLKQLRASKITSPDLDPALALAIGYRESGNILLKPKGRASTYISGGLDHLREEMRSSNFKIPPGYNQGSNKWRRPTSIEEPNDKSELGGSIAPASVPKSELLVAYASTVEYRKNLFIRAAQAEGFDTSHLSTRALRTWTTIFFMAQGGKRYGETSGKIGGITVLTRLKHLQQSGGESLDLNAILNKLELQEYHIVKRGIVSAGEAEMIDEYLFAKPMTRISNPTMTINSVPPNPY